MSEWRALMKWLVALVVVIFMASSADARKNARRLVIEPISAEQCQQLRDAIMQWGEAIVIAGAASKGYTQAQVKQARAYCQ